MDISPLKKLVQLAARTTRRPDLAVFPGRSEGRFIDNGKYAFLHCHRHLPELDCHFLTTDPREARKLRERGLPALLFGQGNSLEVLLEAGLVISDDFWWKNHPEIWAALHPARTIQIWHGIPLKAIGLPEINSSVNMTPEKASHLTFGYTGYDSVVSTSPFFTQHAFRPAFGAEDFPELGYPRNDALLRRHDALDMINVDTALYAQLVKRRKQGSSVVFYMPTFRDLGNNPFQDGAMRLEAMDAFAREHDVLFVLKFHPYIDIDAPRLPETILLADSKSDAYPLLSLCDVLVTDYSSVFFDFLLLDRPMIFYPYDYEDYTTKNRELLFDYDEMIPGPRVDSEAALYAQILSAIADGDAPGQARRAEIRAMAFKDPDGDAGTRLGQYITRFNQNNGRCS
ncbi:MAG: CDP-glycerol glycerophosphotransferase family protein [Proteobacteria bacterium]|nr:CDP-glycerol glycerophosphotransferase family protein [Pseudomonadota bacterium]